LVLGVASLPVFPAGVARAQSPAEIQYRTELSSTGPSRVLELEARVGQDAVLERGIGEFSAVGPSWRNPVSGRRRPGSR
jgi:hypothetical protein